MKKKSFGKVWVFDLDNTLHDACPHIFPHISASMTRYIQSELGMSEAEASSLRVSYWRRYGATLLGLMRHHGTDPRHFLWHTHQFPHLSRMVVAEKGLAVALKRLPGRKVILSNAPAHYTQALLRILRIDGLFERVFTVESMGFRPKPNIHAYRRMLRTLRLDPRRCIMVEDTLANLMPARRLGMATVWVSSQTRIPAGVDKRITSVRELPKIARRI